MIDVFVKDIINIQFEFLGYCPTALEEACEFFRHFLRENRNDDHVLVLIGSQALSEDLFLRRQCWLFSKARDACMPREPGRAEAAKVPEGQFKHIPFIFPQTDDFVRRSEPEQQRILGDLITQTIQKMVDYANR